MVGIAPTTKKILGAILTHTGDALGLLGDAKDPKKQKKTAQLTQQLSAAAAAAAAGGCRCGAEVGWT